ncbi:hypothetical protein [Seleniivibrio sp.]|uniref:hypothetical protein n=1 Tax=Seleniivibrio sp. TaxID=2898801 RepID=UPI0025F766E8|nr:hypothetical protein [Seleniivibrio sp.]MCD8554878.1 hypothetical protein [Seleniivibrio sp.]
MGCCGGNNHKEDKCGCESDGCGTPEEMMSFAFNLEKSMFEELNEAAKANEMSFEEFIYNCMEVGIAITNGELALIDTDQLNCCEEDEEEGGCGCDCK